MGKAEGRVITDVPPLGKGLGPAKLASWPRRSVLPFEGQSEFFVGLG